jgi:hypothetical protein
MSFSSQEKLTTREKSVDLETVINNTSSFGKEKLVVPLIVTPNVNNANRRQEKDKKLNCKLCGICVQKGIVFIFANNLNGVLEQNYSIGGFKKGKW